MVKGKTLAELNKDRSWTPKEAEEVLKICDDLDNSVVGLMTTIDKVRMKAERVIARHRLRVVE